MFVLTIFRRRLDRSTRGPQARTRRRQPLVEALEGRQLRATFTVTSASDSGAGSLRQAILLSNATTGTAANTINFDVGGGGTQTIALQSALPTITQPVTIDGTTQPGCGAAPRIVLDGENVAAGNLIGTDATGNHALGNTFSGVYSGNQLNGIRIDLSSDGNVVEGNFIGTDVSGNRDWGILVNQSGHTTLNSNTFKGNGLGGVHTN